MPNKVSIPSMTGDGRQHSRANGSNKIAKASKVNPSKNAKGPKSQNKPKPDSFVLASSDVDDGPPSDVIGVFSNWTALVNKAQSVMKKRGESLPVVEDMRGATGTIPKKPFPEHLTHPICLASTFDFETYQSFSLFVQRTCVS